MNGGSPAAAPALDIGLLERMLAANPTDGGVWSTLGILLRRAGKLEAAAACHHQGLAHAREHAGIWSNLGNVECDLGRFDAALHAHRRACALAPDTASSWFNHVIALRKDIRFEETLRAVGHALALSPGDASLLWERALTLLQTGDYGNGLAAYEIRRNIASYRNRVPPGPAWDGGPIAGRTLFISSEQGFGDALLAARYIPLVKARGPRIVLECHNELRRVLAEMPVDGTIATGDPLPAYDAHASLMSLPWLCGTTADTVPPPVQITVPDDARVKAARLVGPQDGTLKVGIVWSGRVTFADNARRATNLQRFLRFLAVPGVRLFSLQKGPPEAQLAELGTQALVSPLGPELDDFAVTAAVIERLDLVIMTDSSVAHLAGSLGRPVWNLVQYVPYWIYGFEGERTPWYPSMRLFRQGRDEDWDPVFEEVRGELSRLVEERRAGR